MVSEISIRNQCEYFTIKFKSENDISTVISNLSMSTVKFEIYEELNTINDKLNYSRY